MRAVSENPELAGVAGVEIRRVIRIVWLLGAALACIAGISAGLLVQIRPQMGQDLLLPLFAAAILGGIGSVPGAMLAGLIVGLSEAFAVQLVGAEWRAAVAFVILVLVLLLAPAGHLREGGMSLDLVSYGAFFLTMALTYAVICLGLNVQWGQTGLFNVGIAGFVAVGAYVSALLTTPDDPNRFGGFGLPIAVGWIGGALATSLVSFLIGALTIRLRADYLAIATFGVAVVVQLVALNLEPVTGGPFGIGFIPRPFADQAGDPLTFSLANLGVLTAIVLLLYLVLERLARSPWGRVLRAIREDEQAALALGKNAVKFRLQAFAIGGGIMGLAGAVQAHFIGFIAPDNYVPMLTFQVWAMLIVGGSGNNKGAILGAVLVWGIWAASAAAVSAIFPPGEQARAAALQIVMIGVALCAILLLRPRGILGEERVVSRHLGGARAFQSTERPPMPKAPDRTTIAGNLSISRLVCGLWQVADIEKSGETIDPERGADALQAYAEAGFDTFDMADHYGSAEIITGRLLSRYPMGEKRPLAFTKWCPEPGPMTADVVRKGVQERLDRLGVEKVDLLQFHWWTFEHPAWLDALHEMAELKKEGLIGAIGVTNFDAAHLRVALSDGVPLATNQVSFSLVDRRAAGELSALCREKGVKLLAYGTLCGGFLSEKWLGKPEPAEITDWSRSKYKRFIDVAGGWQAFQGVLGAASEIARKHGVSISNVATRWVLEHEAVAAAIIGARLGESEHRDDNLKVFGFALDARGPCAPRRGFCRDEADPWRLRRRIPQAALSHRVRRPQPPSRCHPIGVQGGAGARPA